ncbi:MAG TPA: RimK family alpha-L-glutamate ligase [Firmicutes bacterium]|nr:RimK family alpha-L-glutamate ligase [Bacillota bacterium]
MARLAIFTERYTIRKSVELTALSNFRLAAHELGHQLDFIFRNEICLIDQYDGIFIRALTDPLNASFVVTRLAQMKGKRVIDDPSSIRICCDKVNMYAHLMRDNIPIPATVFLKSHEVTAENARELFETLGVPLVLKAPNSSFSAYVDKVSTAEDFVKVGKRFLRRADRIVVQQYMPSDFDWRVITLDGKVLAIAKYVMTGDCWKIQEKNAEGKTIYCDVLGVKKKDVDPRLLQVALDASRAIGAGLYGVDIKEVDGEYYVVEVNDNPNIDAGLEDQASPEIYRWIVQYLAGEKFEGL